MTPFNRKLLYLILLYTCIEGLVVNLTFPSKLGFVAKDFLLVASIVLLLADNQGQPFGSLSRLALVLGLFALVQVTYLLVPGDMPLLAKLVGLKMRLLYIPALLLGYRFVRAPIDAYRLSLVLAAASIPVAIFGIYLYFAGPEALVAMGASYSAMITSTTGFWRVPGTFNSPGQYGLYLMFNSILVIGVLMTPGLTLRTRAILWVSLGLMVLAVLVSGSRTPIVLIVACAGMITLGLGKIGRTFSWAISLYLIFAIGFATLGPGIADRVGSIASTDHITRFNNTYFGQMFIPKMLETPMGIGLGAATIGARHFSELQEVLLIESYWGIIALETGVLGFLVFLMASATIVLFMMKARVTMRNADAAPLWYALASYVLVVTLMGPVNTSLDSTPGNLYYWLALGILARLYDLHRYTLAPDLPGVGYSGRPA